MRRRVAGAVVGLGDNHSPPSPSLASPLLLCPPNASGLSTARPGGGQVLLVVGGRGGRRKVVLNVRVAVGCEVRGEY